ncbi:MAG: rhomboid family intramembrane serine protease [bacterium]
MNSPYRTQWAIGGRGLTDAVKRLLIANGIVYLLQWVVGSQMIAVLGLRPRLAWSHLYVWQFFTYMFLHGGFFHILFNMYALWVFGGEVERMWGPKAFYRYYFTTGVGAGLIYTLLTPFSMVPTIGASGAVLGVLTAFAMMFPDREITLLLFFILPVRMRARTLALLFAGMSLFSGIVGSADGVAHFAHLGGMLVGYLYMKRDWQLTFMKGRFRDWKRRRRMRVVRQKEENLERLRKLVDQVLDKANEVGMENLTRDEKLLLKRASKILNKEK